MLPVPSFSGLEHNTEENFSAGLVTRNLAGDVLEVASGSRTYVANEICNKTLITLDGDGYASAQAQKLPSGASLRAACLPEKGDYMDVLWWNQSVDENPTINFSASAGLDALIASSSAGSVIEIPADRGVLTRFMNVDGASISIMFSEFRDSD